MKNIKFIVLAIALITAQSFAQLKPVQYNDENLILNGFKIAPSKANGQKMGVLILPA